MRKTCMKKTQGRTTTFYDTSIIIRNNNNKLFKWQEKI